MEQNDEAKCGLSQEAEKAIREYQCSGCMSGPFEECYKTETGYGVGCREHYAGTFMIPQGKLFLGMPKGFNRLGHYEDMKVEVWENYDVDAKYDKFNVPVWKHLDKHGNTLVRGLRPRLNEPFVSVFLGNHMDKIDCREISLDELKAMD